MLVEDIAHALGKTAYLFFIKNVMMIEFLTGNPNVLIVPEYFNFEDLEYFEIS